MKILLEAQKDEERIAPMTFAYREDITEAVIAEGVTEIGAGAFLACRALRRVHFPDSLRVIGEMAFWESGLYEVTLPESLLRSRQEYRDRTECVRRVRKPLGGVRRERISGTGGM